MHAPLQKQGYLELLGCWAYPRKRQTGHINHWRTQRIHLSVSAVVNSPPNAVAFLNTFDFD